MDLPTKEQMLSMLEQGNKDLAEMFEHKREVDGAIESLSRDMEVLRAMYNIQSATEKFKESKTEVKPITDEEVAKEEALHKK